MRVASFVRTTTRPGCCVVAGIDALRRIATRGPKVNANGCSDVRENVDCLHHGAASLRRFQIRQNSSQ